MAAVFVDLARAFLAGRLRAGRTEGAPAAGLQQLQSAAALLPEGGERAAAERFIDLAQTWLAAAALTGEFDPVRYERLVENLDALAALAASV